eukprot:3288511-Pleurochrysis_carterae.AAC.2
MHSVSCRSTDDMSSGETMKRVRSTAVKARDGLFGSESVAAAGAAVLAPERVPAVGPALPPSAGVA